MAELSGKAKAAGNTQECAGNNSQFTVVLVDGQRIYDKLVVMIWLWESEKLKLHRGQIQALDNFLAIVERTEAGSILGPWSGTRANTIK